MVVQPTDCGAARPVRRDEVAVAQLLSVKRRCRGLSGVLRDGARGLALCVNWLIVHQARAFTAVVCCASW